MSDTFSISATLGVVKVLEPTARLRLWSDSRLKEPRLEQWHMNRCAPFNGEWVPVTVVIEESASKV